MNANVNVYLLKVQVDVPVAMPPPPREVGGDRVPPGLEDELLEVKTELEICPPDDHTDVPVVPPPPAGVLPLVVPVVTVPAPRRGDIRGWRWFRPRCGRLAARRSRGHGCRRQ